MSFDARDPGTDASTWAASDRPGALPALDPATFASVVVLAAHADDETLGVGGLLARATAAGVPVTLVVASDGAASHGDPAAPGGAGTTGDAGTPGDTGTTGAAGRPGPSLAAVRAAEARAAARVLGVGRVVQLDHPDGGLREAREGLRADLERLLDELVPREGRHLVLTTWRGDGHRDHRILAEVAGEVVAARHRSPRADGRPPGPTLAGYPVWTWHWGDPGHPEVPWDSMRRVDLDDGHRRARRTALAAYPSQTTGEGDRPPVLHERFLAHADRPWDLVVVEDLGDSGDTGGLGDTGDLGEPSGLEAAGDAGASDPGTGQASTTPVVRTSGAAHVRGLPSPS